MKYEVYNRDEEEIPFLLSCIVYWKKGCSDQPYWKGEIFDDEGDLASDYCDFSVKSVVSRLHDYVFTCQGCNKSLAFWKESDSMEDICEDCYAKTKINH